jgi:uncharacterized protein YggE
MFQRIYQKLQTKEGLMLTVSVAIIIAVVGCIVGGFRHHEGRGFSDGTQAPSITVSGNGEVFAVPDVAQFSFTITKDAKTMADAQKQVSDLGNGLIEKLKAAGIQEKDIKTEGFNAYPKYETAKMDTRPCSPTYCPPSNGDQIIVGYTVSHTYSVKVRNLEKSSDIAKLLTDANVSSVNGPDFTIADIDSVKNDARDKAIVDAKAQAKVLAQQLGVRLGDIIDFQVVDNGSYPMPMYAKSAMAAADSAGTPTPNIEPGQSDIKVQVQITYRIH